MLDNFRQIFGQHRHKSLLPPPTPTFPRFSELPIEIRLKIWRLAIAPRAVQFPIAFKDSQLTQWDDYHRPIGPSSRPDMFPRPVRNHNPPVLEVNSEARDELSPFYQKSFGFTEPPSRYPYLYKFPITVTLEFRNVLFNHHIDTLCLHWPFTSELARYGANGLDNLQHVAMLVERRNVNLSRYAPLHFIEFCLRCEKLESFRVLLAYSPGEPSTPENEGEYDKMKLERSLIRAAEIWGWTDCTIPWPEGSTPTERQAMFEECLKRWKTILKVVPFKMQKGENW